MKKNLKDANLHYKNTVGRHRRLEGDLVMVRFHKNHFPTGTCNKLKDEKIGHFCILQKIEDNAYKINFLADMNIFNAFNVTDIFEYFSPDEFSL